MDTYNRCIHSVGYYLDMKYICKLFFSEHVWSDTKHAVFNICDVRLRETIASQVANNEITIWKIEGYNNKYNSGCLNIPSWSYWMGVLFKQFNVNRMPTAIFYIHKQKWIGKCIMPKGGFQLLCYPLVIQLTDQYVTNFLIECERLPDSCKTRWRTVVER